MTAPSRKTSPDPVHALKHALLSADNQLDEHRALALASHLADEGWRCGSASELTHAGGIPATRLKRDTHFLLHLQFTGEESCPADEACLVTSNFTSEGAIILGVENGGTDVGVRMLSTVGQALTALSRLQTPSGLLERWLREVGYTGDIAMRLSELARELSLGIEPDGSGGALAVLRLGSPQPIH